MIPVKRSHVLFPNILLNEFFGDELYSDYRVKKQLASPALNIIEVENGFRVELAAPGIAKEDFKIDVDKDNKLLISVDKKTENEEKKEHYLRREFGITQFKQTLLLPEDADKDAIAASYENGVLTITIPKKVKEEVAESKVIEVL